MGVFEGWRRRRAAKAYGRRMGPALIRTYGASDHYTPEQIRAAAQRQGLDLGYICLAYAIFLSESEYMKIAPTLPVAMGFEEARALFEHYRAYGPWSGSTGVADFNDASLGGVSGGSPDTFGGGGGDSGGAGGGGGGDSD
jgi:hypothetical protein